MISLIVAVSKNRVIGAAGQLPWHIPEDLKLFKRLTSEGTLIMGRKTFESLPRILPNRIHVVISSQPVIAPDSNVHGVTNVSEALKVAKSTGRDIFVIGGGEVYRQFLPHVEYIFETVVQTTVLGDTYFEPIDRSEWSLIYPFHIQSIPQCVMHMYKRK